MNKEFDLSRYEGHSEGDEEIAWRTTGDNFVMNGEIPSSRFIAYVEPVSDGTHKIIGFSDADANLIADAPLLLEEVKRLRYIVDSIPDEVWNDMKTWEAMKGVIE